MNAPLPSSYPRRLDHIGIIVRDIEKTAAIYSRAFGVKVEKVEDFKGQLKIAFLRVGDSWIELLQPLTNDDENARFLKTHGEGLHHMAFEVEDVLAALKHIKAQGLQVIDDYPRPGANSATIAFLSKDYGGALVEILHFPDSQS
jgi:methylmalonyl-CoA epimerase